MQSVQSLYRQASDWTHMILRSDRFLEIKEKINKIAFRSFLILGGITLSCLPNMISVTFCFGIALGFTKKEAFQNRLEKVQAVWTNFQNDFGKPFSFGASFALGLVYLAKLPSLIHLTAVVFGAYIGQNFAQIADDLPPLPLPAPDEPQDSLSQIQSYASHLFQAVGALALYVIHPNIYVIGSTLGIAFEEGTGKVVERVKKIYFHKAALFAKYPVTTSIVAFEALIPQLPWTWLSASLLYSASISRRVTHFMRDRETAAWIKSTIETTFWGGTDQSSPAAASG